jgi:hypothetical protein
MFINLLAFCLLYMVCAYDNIDNYNNNDANVGVWLSGASYCSKSNYMTMKLGGPAKGFVVDAVLHDSKTDLLGYTGFHPPSKSIYMVFRGSSSLLNWLDDFEVKKTAYDTFPESKSEVHTGFYKATKNLLNQTESSIKTLRKKYPEYRTISTGHSLGAAIAQMMAMEMAKIGIPVQIYNYGQPRVGDKTYADLVNKVIGKYNRITHNKDMVVHLPPKKEMDYYHSCQERFESEDGGVKTCSATNCEDETCADQYSMIHTNSKDHMAYLGHELDCGSSTVL